MEIWRWIVFGVVTTSVWGLVHTYLGLRLIRDTRLQPPYNRVAWALVASHALLAPVVFFGRGYSPSGEWYYAITFITYVGMGFVATLLVIMILKDLFVMLMRLARRFSKDPDPIDEDRRALLTSSFNLGAFAVTGVTTGVGLKQALKIPDVVEVEVAIPGLSKKLDGFTVAQLSDIHIGPTLKRKFLRGVVDRTMKLDADLIVITGDLIDGYVDQLSPELEALKDLKAEHGVFFCTGNHEYYWDVDGWVTWIATQGVETLLNEHRLITTKEGGRLLLGGVTDYKAGRRMPDHTTDPHKAIDGAPEHDFSLLLAHQPTSIYEAQKAGWNMQLSGHTHGGQFWPWSFFVGLYHQFSRGLGKLEDTWIYVSSGTGYWGPPNRFGAPSEITRITLKAS